MTFLVDPPSRRRIGLALTWFAVLAALAVTLYPFRFSLEVGSLSRIDWRLTYRGHSNRDLIQNLLMLVPLGAGLALIRAGRVSMLQNAVEAGAVGTGLALVIETLQIFEPGRFPQLADVWRNGVGCIAGAIVVAFALDRMTSLGRERFM